jgi:hypothetical protein
VTALFLVLSAAAEGYIGVYFDEGFSKKLLLVIIGVSLIGLAFTTVGMFRLAFILYKIDFDVLQYDPNLATEGSEVITNES